MTENTSITPVDSAKAAQCLRVLRLMNDGSTQKDACEQIGISPQTFRRWVAINQDAVDSFRALVQYVERSSLVLILSAQEELLESILYDVETASLKDKLKVAQYFDKKVEQLAANQHASNMTEDRASEYLQGPALKKAKSRTVNVKAKKDGSVDVTVYSDEDDIEDAEFIDAE